MRRLIYWLMIGAGILSMTGCARIVKTGTEAELTGEVSFEDSLDVAGFWDSQAVPEVKENAVELSLLLKEAAGDIDSVAEKYGRYTNGTTGSLNYAVHVTGVVEEVNMEKKAGFLVVSLDDYEGDEKIYVQTGSVIKKTSIRDYLSFINVNDYSDQIQFAQLSKSINEYVCENVTGAVDLQGAEGKSIDVYGCFTFENDDEVLITPVVMSLN